MTDLSKLAASLSEVDALLALLLDDDHSRGCEGRQYDCQCGYDLKIYDQAKALRDHLQENA